MLSPMLQASSERLAHDLNVLANDIGVRLAGTSGERAAADHIIARAREIGADPREEIFPVQSRVVADEQLEVQIGGEWRRFPCSLFSNTPGTNGEWRTAGSPCSPPPTTSATISGTCAGRP